MPEIGGPANRVPFIASGLRPNLAVDPSAETLEPTATTAQIAAAARRVLDTDQPDGAVETAERDTNTFLHRRPRVNPDVQYTVLDGEAVLLNLANGYYYTLNRVGTAIWELFAERRPLHAVADEICRRFDVERERARDDLFALVIRLEREGLLQTEGR